MLQEQQFLVVMQDALGQNQSCIHGLMLLSNDYGVLQKRVWLHWPHTLYGSHKFPGKLQLQSE